jgi:hypothetical protein
MGREARRVPPGWVFPEGKNLFDGVDFNEKLRLWHENNDKWNRGEYPEYATDKCKTMTYEEWDGGPPDPKYHMPIWTREEATHWQMYENTTEGTPISPVFADPMSMCVWLAENNASAFADATRTAEEWMMIVKDRGKSLPIFTKRIE